MEQEVYLGFVDEPVTSFSWKSSKIGGNPVFPDDKKRITKCKVCEKTTQLIAQIYSPVDTDNDRILYIFSCLQPACARQSDGWHVFRLLHPINKPIPAKPKQDDLFTVSDDWGSDGTSDWDSVGDSSGLTGASVGSNSNELCKDISQLSITHTELIEVEEYERECFDEFYVAVTEEKKRTKESAEIEHAEGLLKKYRLENQSSDNSGSGGDNFLQEEYEDFESRREKLFFKFMQYLSENPEQIIRYLYYGRPQLAEPLEDDSIPKCSCGSNRVYELQLTPHLITALTVNEQPNQLDFATVLIYTCGADCSEAKINSEVFELPEWLVEAANLPNKYHT